MSRLLLPDRGVLVHARSRHELHRLTSDSICPRPSSLRSRSGAQGMPALLQCRFAISLPRRDAAPWCVDVRGWSCPDITRRPTHCSDRQLLSSMRTLDQASSTTRLIRRSVRRDDASAGPTEHPFSVMLSGFQRPSCQMTDLPSTIKMTTRRWNQRFVREETKLLVGKVSWASSGRGLIRCGRYEASPMCESWNHLLDRL